MLAGSKLLLTSLLPALLLPLLLFSPGAMAAESDLTLDPLTLEPAEPEEEATVVVSTLVRNDGPAQSGVIVEGRVNSLIVENKTLNLAANSTQLFTFSFKLNASVAVVTVLVDPYRQAEDSDYSNNLQSRVIEVQESEPSSLWLLALVGLVVLGGGAFSYLSMRSRPDGDKVPGKDQGAD